MELKNITGSYISLNNVPLPLLKQPIFCKFHLRLYFCGDLIKNLEY